MKAICQLCDSDRSRLAFVKNGYAHFACCDCGSLYVYPRPSSAELLEFYRLEQGNHLSQSCWQESHKHSWDLWKHTLQVARNKAGSGRLLDIGCGSGEFLRFAQKMGWRDVEGIEVIPEIADIAGRAVTADDVEAITWSYAEMGRAITGVQVQASLRSIHAWTRRMLSWWDEFDLLLTPTLAEPPPLLGDLARPDDPGTAAARATPFVAYCAPFNVTGQPAISVPTNISPSGLPIGIQLVSGAWREDLLLSVAGQLEQAMPLARRLRALLGRAFPMHPCASSYKSFECDWKN